MSVDIPALLTPALQAQMQGAARALRLPLRNHPWRGASGAWLGAGIGSSIDFQDHRPYLPGDDPRYIDWQAYARSGNYTMKLYREEVSPCVDLALDLSASMWVDPDKARRSLELFYFAVESAQQCRGALRCYGVAGEDVMLLPVETLHTELEKKSAGSTDPAALRRIPWRSGSLRVFISDLLFPGSPALHPLAAAKGRGVIFVPWSQGESDPGWDGNLEFIDCETTQRRNQRVHDDLLSAYLQAYRRHFDLWREHARQLGILFARVPAEPEFLQALHTEALPHGAVEPV